MDMEWWNIMMEENILVNGKKELQRGKKLTDGDVVEFEGNTIKIEK